MALGFSWGYGIDSVVFLGNEWGGDVFEGRMFGQRRCICVVGRERRARIWWGAWKDWSLGVGDGCDCWGGSTKGGIRVGSALVSVEGLAWVHC